MLTFLIIREEEEAEGGLAEACSYATKPGRKRQSGGKEEGRREGEEEGGR